MSAKPRIGMSTAAETAWFEQEAAPELAPHERDPRRLLLLAGGALVFAAAALGLVLLIVP